MFTVGQAKGVMRIFYQDAFGCKQNLNLTNNSSSQSSENLFVMGQRVNN